MAALRLSSNEFNLGLPVEQYVIPSPQVNPETESFWRAAREGVFVVPRCDDCERSHWYPRAHCPYCWSHNVHLAPSTGRGIVYSYTFVSGTAPYVLAYVQLEEGPSIMTNIVGPGLSELAIGELVEVSFVTSADGTPVPVFQLLRSV